MMDSLGVSNVVDSTLFGMLPIDSTAVSGWITPVLSRWLSFLPPEAVVSVIGFVVAFILDLLEDVYVWFMRFPWFAKALGWIGAIKDKAPHLVGVLVSLAGGWAMTGSPIGGVIAAGVRNMLAKGSLTQATAEGLKRVRGAVVVGALAVALSMVPRAVEAQPVPWLSMERVALAIGGGFDYEHFAGLDYAPPVAWAELKLSYALSDALAIQVGYERPFEDLFDGARYRITTRGFIVLPLD